MALRDAKARRALEWFTGFHNVLVNLKNVRVLATMATTYVPIQPSTEPCIP